MNLSDYFLIYILEFDLDSKVVYLMSSAYTVVVNNPNLNTVTLNQNQKQI